MFGWLTGRSRLTAALDAPHQPKPLPSIADEIAAIKARALAGADEKWAKYQAQAAKEYDIYNGGLGHPDMSREMFINQRASELWRLQNEADGQVEFQQRQADQRHDAVVERLDAIHAAAARKTPLEQIVEFAKAHPLLAGYVATELVRKARR